MNSTNTTRLKTIILKAVLTFYFLAIFNASFVSAQPLPFSFHDLEWLVLEQDLQIAAINQRMDAMKNKLAIARKQSWPEISTFYRYAPDDFNFIDDEFSNRHYLTLRLSKDLVGLSKLLSGKIPEIHTEIDILESQLLDSKRKALMVFRQEYIGILEDSSRVHYYGQLIKTFEKLLELHNTRYKHQEGLLIEVLQVEKELIEAKGLLNHYQRRLRKQREFVAEYFNLKDFEIAWNDVELNQEQLQEDQFIQAALANSIEISLNNARSSLEQIRASTSLYNNFHLSPYLGLRLRGNSFAEVKAVPEFGLRFSMPLGLVKIRKQRNRQFKARENSWKLQSEYTSLNLKKEISSIIDNYMLFRARIVNTQKILELNNEKLRVERSKMTQSVRSIKVDPAQLLELEAETIKLLLEKKIDSLERQKIYYELLYLAGFLWPDDMKNYFATTDVTAKNRSYTRALWLWKTEEIIRKDESRLSFISFCKSKGVTQIYLSLNKAVLASMQQNLAVKNLLHQLHQADVKVSALFGEPLWVYKNHRYSLIKNVQFVLDYNTGVTKSAQFDAIHLDIEPHALPEWSENKNELIRKLVETLDAVQNVLSNHSPKIPLEVDIPTFYDKVDEAALKRIIKIADTITIMTYERKSVEQVLESVSAEIMYSNILNKRYLLGFNSKDFAKEEDLENLMQNVRLKTNTTNIFSGFAIHNYRHYRILTGR